MTLAAYSGDMNIIQMLLRYGTLDHYCSTTFIPPICAATMAGHEHIVSWFTKRYNPNDGLPKTIEGGL